jgi:type III secretion protein N (ATPase)
MNSDLDLDATQRAPQSSSVHQRLEESAGLRDAMARALGTASPIALCGRVAEARGTLIRVAGIDARIGELCELRLSDGRAQMAEVTGLADECALLMPHGELDGLSLGARVIPLRHGHRVPVGDALLGRVLDGFGAPIDGRGALDTKTWRPVQATSPAALERAPVSQPFETGVRSIDALMTLGQGQRIGVFAPAGVGKSTLAGMLVRAADVDVCVVALVGERGREVGEFVRHTLGPDGMARSVVVAATSDSPAAERAKAGFVATTIAESFRDRGQRVLLVMDSVTRLARALREIGLACGEPPTRRGFPPSVFAVLPRLLERAGNAATGSITALYTVLVEGDDDSDPIAEEVRSILDGHIILSRAIAQTPQYPAIDVLTSLSRLMPAVASNAQQAAAHRIRSLIARHREIELLIRVGEYRAGSDPLADEAIAKLPDIQAFLNQAPEDPQSASASLRRLMELAA